MMKPTPVVTTTSELNRTLVSAVYVAGSSCSVADVDGVAAESFMGLADRLGEDFGWALQSGQYTD
tara:strand:- start:298 stop:492 length:195 start_codon:yes stop_codon:yes gene_type:complete